MIIKLADYISTPLAEGSAENYRKVLNGDSELRLHQDDEGLLQPYYASLFTERRSFSNLCIYAVEQAMSLTDVNPSDDRNLFVVSTTKGDNLELSDAAIAISTHFGNKNNPMVVSNACTSGVCAQITAARMLETGKYDNVIVVGCDVQTPFIISGFQSFKALSDELCMPFDAERRGLNVGEAAAVMILTKRDEVKAGDWVYLAGSIHNDANHISGPSRTAEGSMRCLKDVMNGMENNLAFVNVHGTASVYNDDMESIAINRAGLASLPVNGLKGFYGHTMGAAGLLETIISMQAVEHGKVLATRGMRECGTVQKVNVSPDNRDCTGSDFIKLLSGFGGCNAAVRWSLKR